MKYYFYAFIGLIILLSLCLNMYFLMGAGIVINNDNRITNHNEQWQQQWQGQLLINQFMTQGNAIEWKTIECDWNTYTLELNKLHPVSSMFAKVLYRDHAFDKYIIIIYPDIFTKTKEEEKKQ
jgi:hypothetical protein